MADDPFWSAVTERAKPDEYCEGQVITQEITTHDGDVLARRLVRITAVVSSDDGSRQIHLIEVGEFEEYEDSGLVLITPMRKP